MAGTLLSRYPQVCHAVPCAINGGTGDSIAGLLEQGRRAHAGNFAMRNQRDRDNDMKLLTPLLLMAIGIVCGFLFTAYAGHTLVAQG
jgi:hypothetical protein